MSIATTVTDRKAWLAERMKGVGASEAAAALGLSPWESPRSLYLRKVGAIPPGEETEPMRQGNYMEDYIATRYTEATGRALMDRQLFLRQAEGPLMATLDAVNDVGEPVEFKFLTRERPEDRLDETGSAAIPDHWLIQGHQQMFLHGTYHMDFAVLTAGKPVKVYPVERDEKLVEGIVAGVLEFWGCVERRVAPERNHVADRKILHLLYPGCEGEIELYVKHRGMADDYENLGKMIREFQENRGEIKAQLLEALGNHAAGILPDGRRVTRRIVSLPESTITRKAYSYTLMRIQKGPKT